MPATYEVPRPQPTPQPQQLRIWAASASYTTAWGNAGFLTQWARPGIRLTSSWILVRFLTCWATVGTPIPVFLSQTRKHFSCYLKIISKTQSQDFTPLVSHTHTYTHPTKKSSLIRLLPQECKEIRLLPIFVTNELIYLLSLGRQTSLKSQESLAAADWS